MDRLAEHALDLFALLGVPVSARRMFGALGFHAAGLFFAVGDPEEGRIYLKVDGESRAAFEAAGGQPFTYQLPNRQVVAMAYLTPPDAALEDPEEMLPWARLALGAARRAAQAKAATAVRRGARAAPARAAPVVRKGARAAPAGRSRSGAAGSGSRSGRGRPRGGRSG